MSTVHLSQKPSLSIAASVFGAIFMGFGVFFALQPGSALQFFEFPPPTTAADRRVAEGLVVLYAWRDVFIAIAIWATAYHGHRKALGWIVLAGGAVAVADGAMCSRYIGKGEWNHWGYAPLLLGVGTALLGVFD